MPPIEMKNWPRLLSGNNVVARVVMPEGYPLAGTQAIVKQIQASGEATRRIVDEGRTDGSSAFKNELSSVGVAITQGALVMSGATGSHMAEISLNLVPYRERGGMTPQEVVNLWRELTPPLPDVVELSFSADAVSLGADIDLELRGRDIEQLGRAAAELTQILESFDGLYDISNSYRSGKRELAMQIRPEAESLRAKQNSLIKYVKHYKDMKPNVFSVDVTTCGSWFVSQGKIGHRFRA